MENQNEEEKIESVIDDIIIKCLNDPNLPDKVEEYQKEYGRLSEEDLRKTFTI